MSSTIENETADHYDSGPTSEAIVHNPPLSAAQPSDFATQSNRSNNKKTLFGMFALAGIVLVGGAFWTIAGNLNGANQSLVFYTAKKGDLPITVTESGNLESQQTTDIRSEVDSISDRGGSSGTQIIYIIPNGQMVEEGELLVELDSSALSDRLDGQVLATESARSLQIQANVQYENQKTQNVTAFEEAKLAVNISELDLEQYQDEEGGTFQIEMQTIDLAIQEAQATQAISTNDLKGTDALKRLGYRGKGDLEKARLTALSADRSLAQSISRRTELLKYTYQKTKLTLEGAVATAKRSLQQVERDNLAMLEQSKAAKDAADRSFAKEEEKLAKYTEQLDNCKIVAPHAGMATYAMNSDRYRRSSGSVIAEGATVYKRQKIITLPVLSRMQVKTAVHESVLHQIHEGLRATVKIETFPDKVFMGTIKSVGVLPDPGGYMSSDIKIYTTIVTIDGEVDQLKPGMTAVVEIHVDRLKDVLTVPVQAVVQIGRDNWCYVESSRGVDRRMLQLGQTNDQFVEIREGLEEGERVVLNPMAIVDEAEDREAVISPEGDSDASSELFDQKVESPSRDEQNALPRNRKEASGKSQSSFRQSGSKNKSRRQQPGAGKREGNQRGN